MVAIGALALAMVGCSDVARAPSARATSGEADYWLIADPLQRALEPRWDARLHRYTAAHSAAVINGQMLATHALAALHGHRGPSRRDARARAIARLLTDSPPFLWHMPPRPWASLSHAPGWTIALHSRSGLQQPVFETQIVDGLVAAWRARRVLHLRTRLVRRIEREIVATARGSFYRWPAVRLNQFNWNSHLLAAAATVSRDSRALRRDLARYVEGFVRHVGPAPGWIGNLGPGLRFHYNPRPPINDPHNVDSAEYANVVCAFALDYQQARQAGRVEVRAARHQ